MIWHGQGDVNPSGENDPDLTETGWSLGASGEIRRETAAMIQSLTYRSVTARRTPSATNDTAKLRRSQATTRGREMICRRSAAASNP
jgi:hypothetical protein